MASDRKPRPEYFEAVFVCREAALPPRFGIVTGWNPRGEVATDEFNARANEELEKYLAQSRLRHFPVTGGSADGRHVEPGFGVEMTSPDQMQRLGRLFKQDAFFWVQDDVVSVCNVGERTLWPVGRWSERRVERHG